MAPEGRNAMPDREVLTQQILSMTPEELDLFIRLAEIELGQRLRGELAPDCPSSD